MCAILDANVVSEVFGSNRPPAGIGFFDWINTGRGHLVVGGKLLQELVSASRAFEKWGQEAQLAGKMSLVNGGEVEARAEALRAAGTCRSNDQHVIAVAQVNGSRRLYSNDGDLQDDFRDKRLIDKPRGKVYSTREDKDFSDTHRRLLQLRKSELCLIKR